MSNKKTKNQLETEREAERRALFPGQTVVIEIEGSEPIVVEISPVGFKHIRKYGAFIATALSSLSNVSGDNQRATVAHMVPVMMTNGLGLLADCVRLEKSLLSIEDLPHHYLPAIIEAWLIESFFGERKWKPWVTMVENLVQKYTGETPQILEKISSYFSPQDTPDETSSITDNQD